MTEAKKPVVANTDDVIEMSDKVSAKVQELLDAIPTGDGQVLVDKGKELQALNEQLQALTDAVE